MWQVENYNGSMYKTSIRVEVLHAQFVSILYALHILIFMMILIDLFFSSTVQFYLYALFLIFIAPHITAAAQYTNTWELVTLNGSLSE